MPVLAGCALCCTGYTANTTTPHSHALVIGEMCLKPKSELVKHVERHRGLYKYVYSPAPSLLPTQQLIVAQTNLDNIVEAPPLPPPLPVSAHVHTHTHKHPHVHNTKAHTRCALSSAERATSGPADGESERERESARRRGRGEKDGCKARPGAGNLISPGCPAVVFLFVFLFLPQHHFITRFLPLFFKSPIYSHIRPDVLLRLITILQGYAKRLLSRRRYFPLNARM